MNLFKEIFKRLKGKSIAECANLLEPCPICGHKAALITMHNMDTGTEWYHVECGDFEDHGGWIIPKSCNFYGIGYCGVFDCGGKDINVPHHSSPEKAVRWWNEVVVPTSKNTIAAIERNKKKQFQVR